MIVTHSVTNREARNEVLRAVHTALPHDGRAGSRSGTPGLALTTTWHTISGLGINPTTSRRACASPTRTNAPSPAGTLTTAPESSTSTSCRPSDADTATRSPRRRWRSTSSDSATAEMTDNYTSYKPEDFAPVAAVKAEVFA